jgi:hypothetical protein
VKALGIIRFTLTLTPALSPGERENSLPRFGKDGAFWFMGSMRDFFGVSHPEPLPLGEGTAVGYCGFAKSVKPLATAGLPRNGKT